MFLPCEGWIDIVSKATIRMNSVTKTTRETFRKVTRNSWLTEPRCLLLKVKWALSNLCYFQIIGQKMVNNFNCGLTNQMTFAYAADCEHEFFVLLERPQNMFYILLPHYWLGYRLKALVLSTALIWSGRSRSWVMLLNRKRVALAQALSNMKIGVCNQVSRFICDWRARTVKSGHWTGDFELA